MDYFSFSAFKINFMGIPKTKPCDELNICNFYSKLPF